jgi:hypothetical protein
MTVRLVDGDVAEPQAEWRVSTDWAPWQGRTCVRPSESRIDALIRPGGWPGRQLLAGRGRASNVACRGLTPTPATVIQAVSGAGVDAGQVEGLAHASNAFTVFYRRHLARLVAYLVGETGDGELAADLAAEVFAAALVGARRYSAIHDSALPCGPRGARPRWQRSAEPAWNRLDAPAGGARLRDPNHMSVADATTTARLLVRALVDGERKGPAGPNSPSRRLGLRRSSQARATAWCGGWRALADEFEVER